MTNTAITDEAVHAYNHAAATVWREHAPISQGDAVTVDQEAIRAGLAAAWPHLLAELAQTHVALIATRKMTNDANTGLRTQLLAALGHTDDGHTPLSGYISHLVAQRDALKAALAKTVTEETR